MESTAEIREGDMDRFRKAAGHSYRITALDEGGAFCFFRNIKKHIPAIAGAFITGALIFYQSLFIAEIRVEGYRALSEEAVRDVLREEGLFPGARKQEDYSHVKKRLYEEFDEITWVSVFEKGRLIKVDLAEGGQQQENTVDDSLPADIVAARSGLIESVTPLEGNAAVDRGDYVNKGDVLISGVYSYQSTNYERGDRVYEMYSHARGSVMAKTPRRLTYYVEKNEREKEKTGRRIWGISIRIGDLSIDTASGAGDWQASQISEKTVVSLVRPLPFEIKTVKKEEVRLTEKRRSEDRIRKVVAAAVRDYEKKNLEKGEKTAGSSVDLYEEAGVIRAEVFMEVIEDIGEEREIKKTDRESRE